MSLGGIGSSNIGSSNRFAVLAEPKKLNPEKALNSEDVKRKLDGELKDQFDGFLEEWAGRILGKPNTYNSCRETLVNKLQPFEGSRDELIQIISQQIQKRIEDHTYDCVQTGAQKAADSFININYEKYKKHKSKPKFNSIKNNEIRKLFEFTDQRLIKFDQYVYMASFDERLKTDGSITLPHFIRRECSPLYDSKFLALAGSLLSLDGDDLASVIEKLIEELKTPNLDDVNSAFRTRFNTKMSYVLDTIDAQQRDGKFYLQSPREYKEFSEHVAYALLLIFINKTDKITIETLGKKIGVKVHVNALFEASGDDSALHVYVGFDGKTYAPLIREEHDDGYLDAKAARLIKQFVAFEDFLKIETDDNTTLFHLLDASNVEKTVTDFFKELDRCDDSTTTEVFKKCLDDLFKCEKLDDADAYEVRRNYSVILALHLLMLSMGYDGCDSHELNKIRKELIDHCYDVPPHIDSLLNYSGCTTPIIQIIQQKTSRVGTNGSLEYIQISKDTFPNIFKFLFQLQDFHDDISRYSNSLDRSHFHPVSKQQRMIQGEDQFGEVLKYGSIGLHTLLTQYQAGSRATVATAMSSFARIYVGKKDYIGRVPNDGLNSSMMMYRAKDALLNLSIFSLSMFVQTFSLTPSDYVDNYLQYLLIGAMVNAVVSLSQTIMHGYQQRDLLNTQMALNTIWNVGMLMMYCYVLYLNQTPNELTFKSASLDLDGSRDIDASIEPDCLALEVAYRSLTQTGFEKMWNSIMHIQSEVGFLSGVVALATEHCRFNPIVNERLTEQSLEGILAMDSKPAYFKEFSTLYDAGLDQTIDYGSILKSLKATLQKDLYAPYLGKIAEKWNIPPTEEFSENFRRLFVIQDDEFDEWADDCISDGADGLFSDIIMTEDEIVEIPNDDVVGEILNDDVVYDMPNDDVDGRLLTFFNNHQSKNIYWLKHGDDVDIRSFIGDLKQLGSKKNFLAFVAKSGDIDVEKFILFIDKVVLASTIYEKEEIEDTKRLYKDIISTWGDDPSNYNFDDYYNCRDYFKPSIS